MADIRLESASFELGFEAHGVRASVRASDAELFERVRAIVPPGSTPCAPGGADQRFALEADDAVGYRVISPHEIEQTCPDREVALELLDAQLRLHCAYHSPQRLFVHAGVVAHDGRAIVVPGPSFSGKTTLTAALVRAGAVYYSDEFALLDERGLVHPYARPLSVRGEHPDNDRVAPESLGGTSGTQPLPIGLVALTTYRPGAHWRPVAVSPGTAVLALVSNSLPARERPAESMAICHRAIDDAVVLDGERGDADATAEALLRAAERAQDARELRTTPDMSTFASAEPDPEVL